MRPVNSTMHELYKDQPANCSVHTGPILESQDSSSSKTIAPPSVSETIAPPSIQHQSDTFSQREITGSLQHLKPGKAPGPDSICPELIIHAEAALKAWLNNFLSSRLRRLKILKI